MQLLLQRVGPSAAWRRPRSIARPAPPRFSAQCFDGEVHPALRRFLSELFRHAAASGQHQDDEEEK